MSQDRREQVIARADRVAYRRVAVAALLLAAGAGLVLAERPATRLAVMVCAGAVLFVVDWLDRRRMGTAIDPAADAAERLGRGDVAARLPKVGFDPHDRFAAALNRAADAIASRQAQLELMAVSAGDLFWDWELATDVVACTHGGRAAHGAPGDAFVVDYAWWMERIHPQDRELVDAHAAALRAGESENWSAEYRFRRSDGGYHWVWDRGVIARGSNKRAVRVVGCMADISARKEAEDRLQHAERRQRALVTAVSSIVWRDDLNAATQPRNVGWEDFTGQTQAQEFGEGWLDAVHSQDREAMLQAWSGAMASGSVYKADLRLRRKDGVYRWMSARGAPVQDTDGAIVEYIGLYQDVEDYYVAREELGRKTLALGQRVKEMRCLHAITVVCDCERMTVPEILTAVALVLPSALSRPEAGACLIEWGGERFRSPGYLAPVLTSEIALDLADDAGGRIVLGVSDARGWAEMQAEARQLLRTAGALVTQMLSRRKDRALLESQRQELWRRQAMFEQTERLARVGGWEFSVANGAFTCSHEVRRLADLLSTPETGATEGSFSRFGDVPVFLSGVVNEALSTRQGFDRELVWDLPDGTRLWLHAVAQVQTAAADPIRVFGIVKDITSEKQAHSLAIHMANHDALTGLPNRRFFAAKLDSTLTGTGTVQALVLVDLDHFKEVNDTLGHDIGDELLRVVAGRLKEAAGPEATVARLGGDEFAVLAPVADRGAARALAQGVLTRLRGPVGIGSLPGLIGCSAGLAVSPRDGATASELMKNADIALYSGKARGRGAFVPYAPHLRRSLESRIEICAQVRDALTADQFVPFYQPKIVLRSGAVAGFEALLRWLHPSGIRTPGAMMAAFEDHDLALAIHARMMDRVVRDMCAWRDRGLAYGHVALNTAAAQYSNFDLADDVLGRLAEARLPASGFGVEVTETVLLGRDAEAVGPTLQKLHEAGVSIALDDFGTGYASLTHLQQYPVDIIKIDRSFISALGADSGSQAITSALLGLGRSLEMTVVAEGVELAQQADLLRLAGCEQAQGYLFAHPMPAAAVADFLAGSAGTEAKATAQSAA